MQWILDQNSCLFLSLLFSTLRNNGPGSTNVAPVIGCMCWRLDQQLGGKRHTGFQSGQAVQIPVIKVKVFTKNPLHSTKLSFGHSARVIAVLPSCCCCFRRSREFLENRRRCFFCTILSVRCLRTRN